MKVSVILLILAACIVALIVSVVLFVVSESISNKTLQEWKLFQVCLESVDYSVIGMFLVIE